MERDGSIRWMNVALGGWLFVSGFLWLHSQAQFTNAWVVGLAAAAIALISMRVPQVRFVNVLLALWLFASVWALPVAAQGTFWNNIAVAVVMFFTALTPNTRGGPGRHPAHFRTH